MPANPLTKYQLAEAACLKGMFKEWQATKKAKGEPISQEDAAGMIGFGQSALSQYLNGKIPLNVDSATKIATLIGRPVSDFSAHLAKQAAGYASGAMLPLGEPTRMNFGSSAAITHIQRTTEEESQLLEMYRLMDDERRKKLMQSAAALPKMDLPMGARHQG